MPGEQHHQCIYNIILLYMYIEWLPTCFSTLRRKPDWPHAQYIYIYIPLYIHITFSHLVMLVFIYIYIFARASYWIYIKLHLKTLYTPLSYTWWRSFSFHLQEPLYIYCIYKITPQIYKYDIYFLIHRIPLTMKWRWEMRNEDGEVV